MTIREYQLVLADGETFDGEGIGAELEPNGFARLRQIGKCAPGTKDQISDPSDVHNRRLLGDGFEHAFQGCDHGRASATAADQMRPVPAK